MQLVWEPAAHAVEMSADRAAELAREYLEGDAADRREELSQDLGNYRGSIEAVVKRLRTRAYSSIPSGYYPDESFTAPAVSERREDDLLFFLVPESYDQRKPTGLVIVMHGGGANTGRRAPRYSIRPAEEDEDESDSWGELCEEQGLIAVGPSAPWDTDSYYRWCLEEADDYLADVIQECKHRFHVDDDRVFLLGHSMGGFGAFHHAQRQPDRFAAVIAHAGSWKLGYWPNVRGTRLCFINGVHDAVAGERWHYTDVEYGRQTHRRLLELGIDHVYFEHEGGHDASYGKPFVRQFLAASQDLRRDPYFWHVALGSPAGYSRYYSSELKHNRWLTLEEARHGTLEYDELLADEDVKFDAWELQHSTSKRRGAAIEARNLGGNQIEVETQNVASFTLWLHPRMVDISEPVEIRVNGALVFDERVTPSLLTALESYTRRHDWGLIYPIKVTLDVEDE